MNLSYSPLWTDANSESRLTGTWRSALPEYSNIHSPCRTACPVGGHIADWIGQIGKGDLKGAWETLVDNNPFPAIAGRICHHPCQTSCNRADLDETVSICALERFVGDKALAENWAFPDVPKERAQNVAILGGGPAGLSAAYQLRRHGIGVDLYEGGDQLGGLLRTGVPAYRLDKAILDGEIARILALGVRLHLNHRVEGQAALDALRQSHNAVFVAVGASRSKTLPGLDYTRPEVIDSATFLAESNAGRPVPEGKRLVVIGGGSAAMDVARSARRLGREVSVLALESDADLPAQRTEIIEAREEGVTFLTEAMLQNVSDTADGLELTCQSVTFQRATDRTAFQVEPIGGTEFTLKADLIVPAIGQDADLDAFGDGLAARGLVLQTDAAFQTSLKGVFAGGDVSSLERFVTEAVGMGKDAAAAIVAYLDGRDAPDATLPRIAEYSTINTSYHPKSPRQKPGHSDPAARLKSFDEVEAMLDAQSALNEAARCFSCGTCTYCDNCYFYCPDMAIARLGDGYEVNADYCKGCGLCVAECPTGSIRMEEDNAT